MALGESILIVDDDPLLRLIASEMLREAGYVVSEAEDGDIALRRLEGEPVDLAILDLLMPNKEGVETIQEIKRRWPRTKIIAISGGGRVDAGYLLPLAKAMGADAVYKKPLTAEPFLRMVDEALHGDGGPALRQTG